MTRKEQIEAEIAALVDIYEQMSQIEDMVPTMKVLAKTLEAKRAELAKLDEPDPLLIEARERVALRDLDPDYSAKCLAGCLDKSHAVQIALAALRRGMELAAAPLIPRDAGSTSGATMTDAEVDELARDLAMIAHDSDCADPVHYAATLAIRETLKRALAAQQPSGAMTGE